nr:hypothetical protein [Tanacetum cinerariifolium]
MLIDNCQITLLDVQIQRYRVAGLNTGYHVHASVAAALRLVLEQQRQFQLRGGYFLRAEGIGHTGRAGHKLDPARHKAQARREAQVKRRLGAPQPNIIQKVNPQAGADNGVGREAPPLLDILNVISRLLDVKPRKARRNTQARPVKPLVVVGQVFDGNTLDAAFLSAVDSIAALALSQGRTGC